jgi:low temperature requirement protein LtrA
MLPATRSGRASGWLRLVPDPARYWAWAAGLLVELLGPIPAVSTLAEPEVSFHPEHISERYGLFTLIVLGESVLAVAIGTTDTGWDLNAVLTGVSGFVIAACIWWLYFDYVGSSALELGPRSAFYWGYGHLLVYAAIATVGVGT